MPKVVDHEDRRRKVAHVAFEAMRDVGPERTTIREIARRSGVSHSLLRHYFGDSEELYGFIYRYLTESVLERVAQRAAGLPPGIRQLCAMLEESCPHRLGVGAVATLSFWVHSVGNRRNRTMQKRTYDQWRAALKSYTEAALNAKHIAPSVALEDLLDMTSMFVDGLCVASCLEERHWTAARQTQMLDVYFLNNFKPKRRFRGRLWSQPD